MAEAAEIGVAVSAGVSVGLGVALPAGAQVPGRTSGIFKLPVTGALRTPTASYDWTAT